MPDNALVLNIKISMKCAIGWHQNHTYHVHSFWDIPDLNVVHFPGTPTSSTWHRERHGQVTESGGGVNKSPWIWISFDVCLSRLRRNVWKLWAKQMWYIFLGNPDFGYIRLFQRWVSRFKYLLSASGDKKVLRWQVTRLSTDNTLHTKTSTPQNMILGSDDYERGRRPAVTLFSVLYLLNQATDSQTVFGIWKPHSINHSY